MDGMCVCVAAGLTGWLGRPLRRAPCGSRVRVAYFAKQWHVHLSTDLGSW